MGKNAKEVLDFNLYLGPDDLWHAEPPVAPATECRYESDCGWEPWCRISGRCKRAPLPKSGDKP